jgi:predicted nuclease with TOPRIM domain
MRQQLIQRLEELKKEYELGQKTLINLESQQANLRETLLRISGAIQVIEEELSKGTEAESTSQNPNIVSQTEVLTKKVSSMKDEGLG